MKQNFLPSLILVLCITEPSFAEKNVEFTLEPFISHNFGHTEYIMYYRIPTVEGIYLVKSELEFPLDVIMAGAQIGLRSTKNALHAWSIRGGYFTNVADPGGIMKDHDWETVWRLVGQDTAIYWGEVEKFSYTESDVAMRSTQLSVEGFLRVLHKRGFGLDLWGGFRYQKISQDILGYDGWQLQRDSDGGARKINVAGTEPAIDYWISYKSPFIGLRSSVRLATPVDLETKAAFAPVWISDFDDHLLRHKIGTASITGSGVLSGVSLILHLPGNASVHPLAVVTSDITYFHASGNQTQEWYGDDPASPNDDDTGTILPGVPHKINTFQFNVGLRVGFAF